MKKLKDRIKFSPFRARIAMSFAPMLYIAGFSFGLFFFTVLLPFDFSFWLTLPLANLLMFLFLIGILTLGLGSMVHEMIKHNLRISSNIRELRECYPELEQGWDDLNHADYHDSTLQVLVYGDHLIDYLNFGIVYLPECQELIPQMTPSRRHRTVDSFTVVCNDGSFYDLYGVIPAYYPTHTRALLDYVEEKYPHINQVKRLLR